MKVVGIDPGVSGAIALYAEGLADIVSIGITDLPIFEPKGRKVLDDAGLAMLLRQWEPDHVFIEDLHAMPGWGTTGTWSIAKALGTIIGVVGGIGYPRTFVTPKTWQKHHGMKANDGEISRKRAIELVPSSAEYLTRKKHHNRAEALLIALYGFQTLPRSQ